MVSVVVNYAENYIANVVIVLLFGVSTASFFPLGACPWMLDFEALALDFASVPISSSSLTSLPSLSEASHEDDPNSDSDLTLVNFLHLIRLVTVYVFAGSTISFCALCLSLLDRERLTFQ